MFESLLAQVGKKATEAKMAGSAVLNPLLDSLGFLRNFLLAILVIGGFYALGKVVASRIIRALHEARGESVYPDMIILVNRLSVVLSLSIGIAVAIQFIFDLNFLQVIGFFGLGLSFAFKDLLENLIAGTVIIIQNRFRIGDMIQIGAGAGGIKGKVMEIQTRATILKGIDGTEIIVPNSKLMMNPVISYTAHHARRVDFTIKISFDADLKKAVELAEEIVKKKAHVLKKPKPQVILKGLGGSTYNLNVRFWIDPQSKEKSWITTKSELIAEVKEAFDQAGILIPYPTYTYTEKDRTIKRSAGNQENEVK